LRGLFFVHLYGAIEFSICEIVKVSAAFINSRGIKIGHLQTGIYPLALEPQLSSLKSAGTGKAWEKRCDLFKEQASNKTVRLHDGVMLGDLQNIDRKTVELVHQLFALDGSPFVSAAAGIYLTEIKDNRNEVSHGRSSPIDVQKRYSSDSELQKRLDVAQEQIEFMLSSFEAYLSHKRFVRSRQRRRYP